MEVQLALLGIVGLTAALITTVWLIRNLLSFRKLKRRFTDLEQERDRVAMERDAFRKLNERFAPIIDVEKERDALKAEISDERATWERELAKTKEEATGCSR